MLRGGTRTAFFGTRLAGLSLLVLAAGCSSDKGFPAGSTPLSPAGSMAFKAGPHGAYPELVNYGTGAMTNSKVMLITFSDETHVADLKTFVSNFVVSSGWMTMMNEYGIGQGSADSPVAIGSTSCSAFLGYHNNYLHGGATQIKYAIIPECAAADYWPQGFAFIDSLTSVITHELVEASTDPRPNTGYNIDTA